MDQCLFYQCVMEDLEVCEERLLKELKEALGPMATDDFDLDDIDEDDDDEVVPEEDDDDDDDLPGLDDVHSQYLKGDTLYLQCFCYVFAVDLP